MLWAPMTFSSCWWIRSSITSNFARSVSIMRLTGMPGFDGSLSEDEMWQVSLLLLEADRLPPAVQQALK